MSDRSATQKKFNEHLLKCRAEILRRVVPGWESFSEDQKVKLRTMNNYFCGLHFIVGLAGQAQECFKNWETVHFDGKPFGATELPRLYDNTEFRVIRLVKTTANAFEKHGNEQMGCMWDFRIYMEKQGIQVPLAELRGNRNYVCFYNGAGVHFLKDTLLHFLQNVQGETNLLLKSVQADLLVDGLIAGARAPGLFSKFVITPLWKVLENRSVSVLQMSQLYTKVHEPFVQWAQDASSLLEGTARLFPAAVISMTDSIANRLLEPDHTGLLTIEILQVLCTAYASYTSRLLVDRLPGGKYYQPSQEVQEQSRPVASANVVSERDFAQLDSH